jgi:NADPH:quinone reductase-like Zn-dependent oxidoreductase
VKAILYTQFGPPEVLQLLEIEKPSPKDNEVLVKVHASSLNAIEWRRFTLPIVSHLMAGGLREPRKKSIGGDLSGRVEAVGRNVKQFRPGDEVFGICPGAFSEYVCAPEDKLAHKPANVSFEAAAAMPIAGLTALQAVRDTGKIQPGQDVLIDGAGGGVGTFAVQTAKFFGAKVTAVCSTRNQDVARSVGADDVIDYMKEDFARSERRYDLIVAANGFHSILHYKRALKPNGIFVVVGGSMALMFQTLILGPLLSWFGNKKMRGMITRPNQTDLISLKELLETGKVVSVIDRSYPLADIVEAIRYILQGHPRGKVVIRVLHSTTSD